MTAGPGKLGESSTSPSRSVRCSHPHIGNTFKSRDVTILLLDSFVRGVG